MPLSLFHIDRRQFLRNSSAFVVDFTSQLKQTTGFLAGLVPSGKTTAENGIKEFWGHCDEVAQLGVHRIEFNNTRARIAEAYFSKTSEFSEQMSVRGLTLPGIAQFSHMDKSSEFDTTLQQHLLLGEFMHRVGGDYVTHMIAPSSVLNESEDEVAYSKIDVKTWVKNTNETGRQMAELWGIKLAYHPEQREVRHRVYQQFLDATDERYVHLIADVGHLAAGGAEPVEVCQRYRKRLVAVHLKDFSPVPPAGISIKAGNVPFGKGTVDMRNILAILQQLQFTGWIFGESGGTDAQMYDYMSHSLGLRF